MVKVGIFGARASNSGLGVQTWEFVENIKPAAVLVVDISSIDGKPTHPDRYPGAEVCAGFPDNQFIESWVERHKDLDVVYCAEIPYNYYLFEVCRRYGIKTVLNYNYEFLDYLQTPNLPLPDLLLAPSDWNFKEAKKFIDGRCKITWLPFPVNTSRIKRRKIKQAVTFVHVAGHKLYEDRNGTELLLQALPYIKNDHIKIHIFSQHNILNLPEYKDLASKLEGKPADFATVHQADYKNYWELFEMGDVLVLPRRYGGQSLQMNEAMAAGMIPLMLDIPPQNYFLAEESLVDIEGVKKIHTRIDIDCAMANPKTLANKIDNLSYMPSKRVKELSTLAGDIADNMSWAMLGDVYMDIFEGLKNEQQN